MAAVEVSLPRGVQAAVQTTNECIMWCTLLEDNLESCSHELICLTRSAQLGDAYPRSSQPSSPTDAVSPGYHCAAGGPDPEALLPASDWRPCLKSQT